MKAVVVAILAGILAPMTVLVPAGWAQWIPGGMPVTPYLETQTAHAVVSDGAGGAILFFSGTRDHSSGKLYAQRLDSQGIPQWDPVGVPTSSLTSPQWGGLGVSDGAGGAILVWVDPSSPLGDNLLAQRIGPDGVRLWAATGVPVCSAFGDEEEHVVASDGAGGVIVAWTDHRAPISKIYAQRVSAAGILQWQVDGILICMTTGAQTGPAMVSDGQGGAIIAWEDSRSGNVDIYARRVNGDGTLAWATVGAPLCVQSGSQEDIAITTDGANGAIVGWEDYRSGTSKDVYAQRILSTGVVQWSSNGIPLCTQTAFQENCQLVSDGAGGAFAVWTDLRWSNYDLFAQRVNGAGVPQWTANGIPVCWAAGDQRTFRTAPDGVGGMLVAWESAQDIYIQRLDASGDERLEPNGLVLCGNTSQQLDIRVAADGTGGGIVAWTDRRSDLGDAYAQQVDGNGYIGYLHPDVVEVRDVPNDQGGKVRLTIRRSPLDGLVEIPVAMYNVWQRLDDSVVFRSVTGRREGPSGSGAATEALLAAGWPLAMVGDRVFLRSRELETVGPFPAGTWELVGSFASGQQDEYVYQAGTVADSSGAGTPYSVYIVSAHTTDPGEWFTSYPDSGYSVDNIPPPEPDGLFLQQTHLLRWNACPAEDFHYFTVYGSDVDHRDGSEVRIGYTIDTFLDIGSEPFAWLLVTASDCHDNESDAAVLSNQTGTVPPPPTAFAMSPCAPNPFTPRTTMRFSLPVASVVSVDVFDVAGRRVRRLIEGELIDPGDREASWDGRDDAGNELGSGVYFLRMNAGAFSGTRQVILVR